VQAVHDKGGRIVYQIWHGGRTTDPSFTKTAAISSTDVAIKEGVETKAATQEDLDRIRGDFKKGAERAKRVGFDAIELHAGFGFLIDSFIRDGLNTRTDKYGGSIENRCRFLFEVLDTIIEVFGHNRVGLKISPRSDYQGNSESNVDAWLAHIIEGLNKRHVAFVEVSE